MALTVQERCNSSLTILILERLLGDHNRRSSETVPIMTTPLKPTSHRQILLSSIAAERAEK